ncbi:kinase-like domain-containing protein [Xylariaceae sp. FL1019]|nr:kinase-like domain-containing protein [Xylariaceae sp. FL1019]
MSFHDDYEPNEDESAELPYDTPVEDLDKYAAGGLHPTHLGDFLGQDKRFEVQHKLGHSNNSTVWLCHDREQERHVAIKILRAEISSETYPELIAQKLFSDQGLRGLDSHQLSLVKEHFWIEGPNGRHLCLVTDILGPPISYSLEGIGLDTPDLLSDFCLQITKSLKYLHDNNICHGDYRPDHMRLQFDTEAMKGVNIYDLFGRPKIWKLQDSTGKANHRPRYVVEPGDIRAAEMKYRTGRVIVDSFAMCHHVDVSMEPRLTEASYIPPEVLLQKRYRGFSSDIWALASTIHLIKADKLLLAALPSKSSLISWMAWAYGPFPQESWNKIGDHLADDAAVPVFSVNKMSQKPPKSALTNDQLSQWHFNRSAVISFLLGVKECPREERRREGLREDGDRSKYLRVKLPKNLVTWTKFQEERKKATGWPTLLHEDLSKDRTWYVDTDPVDRARRDRQSKQAESIDDELAVRLNVPWKTGTVSEQLKQPADSSNSQGGKMRQDSKPSTTNPKKRPLDVESEEQPKPKRVKTFIAESTLRDRVECVEQDDGMTRYSYRLQREEVESLADLLGKMLKNDPKERIGIDEVLAHKWFKRMVQT